MLMLPPVLGLDPSKAAAAAPGQRLATLTDSHVGRLLRDDCYSHLLEVAVAVMPQQAGPSAVAAAAEDEAGATAAGGEEQEWHSKKKKKRKLDAAGEQEEDGQTPAAAAAGGSGKGVSLADEFYERFLKGRLLPLCCHHCANFVIQAVLAATSNRVRVSCRLLLWVVAGVSLLLLWKSVQGTAPRWAVSTCTDPDPPPSHTHT